ncbi:hypothetical protein Tco_0029298, partial [Tanacetum coccineum]
KWNGTFGVFPIAFRGNVISARTTRLQCTIKLANSLMDQKIHVFVATQADNKRRMENNPRDDHVQQPAYKRQNIARAYTVGPGEKKEYAGTLLLCNKCKYHHTGPCTAKCKNYKRVGHQTNDCRSLAAITNQRALMANQRTMNRGNQTENGKAWGMVYALGGGEADQDPNNITDNANA